MTLNKKKRILHMWSDTYANAERGYAIDNAADDRINCNSNDIDDGKTDKDDNKSDWNSVIDNRIVKAVTTSINVIVRIYLMISWYWHNQE